MEEITKHINDTNASYRHVGAGDAKNTDLFLDNEHYDLFRDCGEQIVVRFHKTNLTQAILFIASILPRKFDQSANHCVVNYSNEFVFDQLAILDALFKENGVPVNTFTQTWNARKDVFKKNGERDGRFYFNNLLKDVEFENHNGNTQTTKFTIRNYFAGGFSNLNIKRASDGVFDIKIDNVTEAYDDGKEKGLEDAVSYSTECCDKFSRQRIYYGAPGTGKSHEIKTETAGNIVVRTTFHPDSDYSTFVGCYKPTTDPVYDRNGNKTTEEKITYRFSEQAFFQAYTKAWEELQKPAPKPVFLIIEEINRGNCAQIFGDLFQLLDRCQIGYSEYPIVADFDMNKQLFGKFEHLQLDGHIEMEINKLFVKEYPNGIVPLIQKGKLLLLPKNLYIWATMNTSDQSLFPIDSAFKRRWEWRYVKINKPDDKDWELQNGTKWWDFIQKINYIINKLTSSADKQLGYFFAKADDDKTITNDKFVSKVCFYLWNDIFKTYATDDLESSLFKFDRQVGDTTQPAHLTFPDFYDEKGKVIDSVVERFIQNVMSYEVL